MIVRSYIQDFGESQAFGSDLVGRKQDVLEDNEENVCQAMKVLHIIPSMEIGGAQRLLSDLLP